MAAAAERRIARLMSVWAGALAASTAILPPALVFLLSYQHVVGTLESEAELNAQGISQIVGANPDMWQYEQLRISEYLSRRPREWQAESRRVLDLKGALVAESADPLPAPVVSRSVPLFDAGAQVGAVEVSRSLRWLLVLTGGIAFGLLPVSALAFRELRTIPLRAIAESQAALRRERDTAQRYLGAAEVAFVTLDRVGRVSLVNRKGAELLGRSIEEVIGEDWEAFIDPGDRARVASAAAAARGGDVVSLEYAIVRPGGERRSLSWCVTPLVDDDGTARGLLGSGVDITRQRELEDQLRHAEKLHAFGQLASGVVHDLSESLAAIKGNAAALRDELSAESPLFGHVEKIVAAAQGATSLSRALLTFGRRQDVRPEPVDLRELVRQNGTLLRRLVRHGVELELDVAPAPLPILADAFQLHRVLIHLVTNARDAIAGHGRIVVSVSSVSLDAEGARQAGLDAPGPYARVSVADVGIGSDRVVRSRMSEPFFTTKEIGSGTRRGLAIVDGVVKQHRGSVQVTSEPGRGTTVTVLLPLLHVADATSKQAASPLR